MIMFASFRIFVSKSLILFAMLVFSTFNFFFKYFPNLNANFFSLIQGSHGQGESGGGGVSFLVESGKVRGFIL